MVAELVAGGTLRVPMSWERWQALGETRHHEYYDGLATVDPPTIRHSILTTRLGAALLLACPPGHAVLTEAGWAPAERTVFVPDLMVARVDRLDRDLLRRAPLVVVEISSPSTRSEDLGRKLVAYAAGGAESYWIVDPDADSVTVRGLGASGYSVQASAAGPDRIRLTHPFEISLDLSDLFA